jgi:hypothetical protein
MSRIFTGMTEADVTARMRAHLEKQFPKVCPNCKRRFESLREFLQIAKPAGPAMPYDADVGDWAPMRPIGLATYHNCPCGSTLAVTSEGMPLRELWTLLNWARIETKKRGMSPRELLNHLREEISREVLENADQ